MIEALDNAGFDETNDNHTIILCGDLFDRGEESQELYDWAINMLEKGKLIYIKGNHEDLLADLCGRNPQAHDIHNGTVKTINQLSGDPTKRWIEQCAEVRRKMSKLYPQMLDYYETEHYIFVHSWIPVIGIDEDYGLIKRFSFDNNWRDSLYPEDWEEARWDNPFYMATLGLNKTGKTIVFGHYHTSYQYALDGKCPEWNKDKSIFDPYYGDDFIGIDGCVAFSGKCNCVVIED